MAPSLLQNDTLFISMVRKRCRNTERSSITSNRYYLLSLSATLSWTILKGFLLLLFQLLSVCHCYFRRSVTRSTVKLFPPVRRHCYSVLPLPLVKIRSIRPMKSHKYPGKLYMNMFVYEVVFKLSYFHAEAEMFHG